MGQKRTSLGNFVTEYSVRNKSNEEIPVYSVTNSQGFCQEYFGKEVASKDKTTYKIVPHGYFAYNPSRINVGSVDWQRCEERVIVSPLYNVFSVSEDINRQFLYYFLKSNTGRQMIQAKALGSVRDNLKLDMLKEMTIPALSLGEQDRCVKILDKLQQLIQNRKNQLMGLDNLVKARFVERFGLPGTDPYGWGLKTLGDCCELNPRRPKNMNTEVEYSFVAMPSVSEDGRVDTTIERPYTEVCKGFTYFAENDVLFAKITPCMENGKGGVAKGLKNGAGFGSTEFHVLRPIEGISDPYWLYIITMLRKFRSDAERVMTGTGGQRRVPITYLNEYKIALPPLDLQKQFAAFVRQSDKSKFAYLLLPAYYRGTKYENHFAFFIPFVKEEGFIFLPAAF